MHIIKVLIFLLNLMHIINTEESPACLKHIRQYELGLNIGLPSWAWRMLDSSTKLPDGLFKGHIIHLGNYDECIDTKTDEFKGQYCRVLLSNITKTKYEKLSPLQNFIISAQNQQKSGESGGIAPFEWSVCAPSTCGPEGVAKIATINMDFSAGLNVSAITIERTCYHHDIQSKFDIADWFALSTVIIILLIVLLATVWDIFNSARHSQDKTKKSIACDNVINCFSLRKSWKDLLKNDESQKSINSIHSIRVLSMAWIMLGHRYTTFSYLPESNTFDVWTQYVHKWSNMAILNAFLAVDTFFFLSGLLLSYGIVYNYYKRGVHLKIRSLPVFYIYRYIRLTVPLALIVFLSATLVEHISNGPSWNSYVSLGITDQCQRNWWKTLLYVNNYINSDGTCVGQTWYLSVDMQLYWLSPIILFPLTRWPKYTLIALVLLILASVSATFAVTYIHDLSWTYSVFNNLEKAVNFSNYVYLNTPMRAAPYLYGVIVGYYIAYILNNNRKITLSRFIIFTGWILSISLCLTVIFSLAIYYEQAVLDYNNVEAAFYASLHRLAFAVGISWIIFACVIHKGGPIEYILSLYIWQPLSRLCYCAFLIHLTIMFMEGATWRNANYLSNFSVVHYYLGDVVISGTISIFMYLIIEYPCSSLLRLFSRRTK